MFNRLMRLYSFQNIIRRNVVTTETGAVLPAPSRVRFGLVKLVCVIVPFVTIGALVSREGAAILEENDIFVPGDDDDD
ncbi:hypothetical protein SNEBB_007586 [Seison nebaliae]|nr:hypothetical protein SNEBB_007586 [Seison nebaliae]